MSQPVFRDDAYLQEFQSHVRSITPEGGIVLEQTIFYPTAGGQPGDSGRLDFGGAGINIATTIKGEGADIILVPSEPIALPAVGQRVTQRLDWVRRHRHMRLHTALHLLSAVMPFPVTGGAISLDKGRLDFKMEQLPSDRIAIETRLNALIEQDLRVTESWISDADLSNDPLLVKTMSVMPQMGQEHVRLIQIGEGEAEVDVQPCGGTHVARTSEIGRIKLGKIENIARENRRISILLD